MEQNNFQRAVDFITSIGIPISYQNIEEETFLPGLLIDKGTICIDREKLKYPGDILHEAGHIAVIPIDERTTLNAATIGSRKDGPAEEMMAIAWSYAACKHLAIDPYFVFHKDGYKGGGNELADQFNEGRYFGVSMLQWIGLTHDPKMPEQSDSIVYPKMIRWTRVR